VLYRGMLLYPLDVELFILKWSVRPQVGLLTERVAVGLPLALSVLHFSNSNTNTGASIQYIG